MAFGADARIRTHHFASSEIYSPFLVRILTSITPWVYTTRGYISHPPSRFECMVGLGVALEWEEAEPAKSAVGARFMCELK